MELEKWKEKIQIFLHQYRYPLLILLAGVLLLTLSGRKQDASEQTPQAVTQKQEDTTEQLLAQILGQIDGVGRVRVMLTVAEGETVIYQSDEDATMGENSSSVRNDTIIVNDADRNQHALIQQILPPKYRGAIIVCQGADSHAVKWAVVEAVSKATGLGADHITVLKMK